jgi:ribosomal protein S18 acetylase RimI-like enzyme
MTMANESPYWHGYRQIRLRISGWKWEHLPRHAAYKYEYFDGKALLSPRPRTVDMALDLAKWQGIRPLAKDEIQSRNMIRVRTITDADWPELTDTFYSAFSQEEPFKSFSRRRARAMAHACLDHTRRGGDDALIANACLLAERAAPDAPKVILGAALITDVRPPPLLAQLRKYHPGIEHVAHLTWLFVRRFDARHGIATHILDHAVRALRQAGHSCLASTTSLGNDASLLWHWKNGFTLLDRGFSVRVGVVEEPCNPVDQSKEESH